MDDKIFELVMKLSDKIDAIPKRDEIKHMISEQIKEAKCTTAVGFDTKMKLILAGMVVLGGLFGGGATVTLNEIGALFGQ